MTGSRFLSVVLLVLVGRKLMDNCSLIAVIVYYQVAPRPKFGTNTALLLTSNVHSTIAAIASTLLDILAI